jgi:SnoaL-like domain
VEKQTANDTILTVALSFAQFFGASYDSLERFFHLALLLWRDILKCPFDESGVLAKDRNEHSASLPRKRNSANAETDGDFTSYQIQQAADGRGRKWAMPDRIHELLNRNLQEVFGEGDATRRRAAIEELYTDDCVLYVPPGVFVGHDALDKFAGDLRATHPHFVYTPHGEPQALHNAGRLAWESGPRGEKPDYTGLDVIIVRDDKIAALYVFLDSMPS